MYIIKVNVKIPRPGERGTENGSTSLTNADTIEFQLITLYQTVYCSVLFFEISNNNICLDAIHCCDRIICFQFL